MATKRLTRQEKKAQIRTDLLDAAEELFAERGYWGVSVDEIADRAGVTKGAVYSNFANKEQLLLKVAWRQRIDVDPAIFADSSAPLSEFLEALGQELARIATSDEQRTLAPRELEIATLAMTNDDIRERLVGFARARRTTIAWLLTERARKEGIELVLPAEEIAAIFEATLRGLSQQRSLDADSIPPEYFVDALRLLFSAAMAGSPEERQGHP